MFKRGLLLLLFIHYSCSSELVIPEPAIQQNRSIQAITVEKPGFPDSEYTVRYDENGKPLSYSSPAGEQLFRSFEYNSEEKLTGIRDFSPQDQIQAFTYENGRLISQTTYTDQSEIVLQYLYNEEEVQVLRFINELYHSTIFFTFSGPDLQYPQEIKSYDGGGQLRHHYLLTYDMSGNVISEEHFRYDIFTQQMTFERRIEQQFDTHLNPLALGNQPGWMPAWYMAHLDSESIIENISRFSPNNVVSRSVIQASGQSKMITYEYEYDALGFPLSCTRLTDGELDIRRYRFEYFYN